MRQGGGAACRAGSRFADFAVLKFARLRVGNLAERQSPTGAFSSAVERGGQQVAQESTNGVY